MLEVLHADSAQQQAASAKQAPPESPAACADQGIVSETTTNSQGAAFETMLSTQPRNASGSGEAACEGQRSNVSETGPNSQDTAFET